MEISKERIIERLNNYSRDALQRASELCIEQGAFEVTVSHYLLAMLGQPGGDVSKIITKKRIHPDALEAKVKKSFEVLRRGSTELPQFSPLLLELLRDAFLISTAELGEEEVRTGAIFIALAKEPDRYCHYYYFNDFAQIDTQELIDQFADFAAGSFEGKASASAQAGQAPLHTDDSALRKFGRNITEEAAEGKIDPVFCRDDEIALMTDVLCRRRKNNPILVGDPGVGKTAVAEGLAIKIIENDVPDALKDAVLWELDLGALQAGASVKGEFERRLKGVIDEVLNSTEKIILFIDEAHTLIGGGGQAGGSDAANLLKPALARGNLRAIAATTWSEYKKYFEKDPALTRRFQLIKLDEPSVEDAVSILRGLRDRYEQIHKVYISDAALRAAASLSARYLTGRQLPDKALDVLDTACVRVAAAQSAKPRALDSMEKKIQLAKRAEEARARDALVRSAANSADGQNDHLARLEQDVQALTERWQNEREIVQEILSLRHEIHELAESEDKKGSEIEALQAEVDEKLAFLKRQQEKGNGLVDFEVGPEIIGKVVSDWTGVPASALSDDDALKVLNLADKIREVIQGQDDAISIIHDRLKAARLDFTAENQPRGVFLLVGPSGVGKTETALQIAEELYGGKQFLTTINMSEYQERHSVSRLIGSPPGYVGYGEGGVLSEAIRKKPYSVVLLDEVEKAHPDILNLFYQVFDKGELFDGEGREIDCSNIVFFMTSNLGSEAIMQNKETVETASIEALEKAIRPYLEEQFKPALLARMRILIFKPLSADTLKQVVKIKLEKHAERLLRNRKVELNWDESCEAMILELCTHSENGARMVDQVIERWIIPPIAEESLQRMTRNEGFDRVDVSSEDGGFLLDFYPKIEEVEGEEIEEVAE